MSCSLRSLATQRWQAPIILCEPESCGLLQVSLGCVPGGPKRPCTRGGCALLLELRDECLFGVIRRPHERARHDLMITHRLDLLREPPELVGRDEAHHAEVTLGRLQVLSQG